MAYSRFHTNVFDDDDEPYLVDTDGTPLYEDEYSGLLLTIIRRSDIPLLNQYISAFTREALLAPGNTPYNDLFWVAAERGNAEVLRILLDEYAAAPAGTTPLLDQRGFSLLHVACGGANIDTVRLILDRDPPLGTVTGRDRYTETPLLAAAGSLAHLNFDDITKDTDRGAYVRDRITRGEELINLLLDRGASASDVLLPFPRAAAERENTTSIIPPQPEETVLGSAVSRAGSGLVKRLIDEGADVYAKQQHDHGTVAATSFRRAGPRTQDVTPLHLASLFWNPEAIKVLLEHDLAARATSTTNQDTDLVSSLDSNGRLPLHWAAAGPTHQECNLPDSDITPRLLETVALLLTTNPGAVNVRDSEGCTPLYYLVGRHATCCSGSEHAERAIHLLLEHGADPGIPDSRGQTVLHRLGYLSADGDPIDPVILELLISRGVDVNHADKDGQTALHIFARNLRQPQAVQFLLNKGADLSATDGKGDTAFHTAAQGIFRDRETRDGGLERVTSAECIQAQDAMMDVLQEGAASANIDFDGLMSQPNAAGRTAQQLRSETRTRWREREQPLTRGRGRRPAPRGS